MLNQDKYQIQSIASAQSGWRALYLYSSKKTAPDKPVQFDNYFEMEIAAWALVVYRGSHASFQKVIGLLSGEPTEGLVFADTPWHYGVSGFISYLSPGYKMPEADIKREIALSNEILVDYFHEDKGEADAAN